MVPIPLRPRSTRRPNPRPRRLVRLIPLNLSQQFVVPRKKYRLLLLKKPRSVPRGPLRQQKPPARRNLKTLVHKLVMVRVRQKTQVHLRPPNRLPIPLLVKLPTRDTTAQTPPPSTPAATAPSLPEIVTGNSPTPASRVSVSARSSYGVPINDTSRSRSASVQPSGGGKCSVGSYAVWILITSRAPRSR